MLLDPNCVKTFILHPTSDVFKLQERRENQTIMYVDQVKFLNCNIKHMDEHGMKKLRHLRYAI